MAAPTASSLAVVTAEGIKKAGYTSTSSTQYTTLLARAQSDWIEEIKNDIYILEKQLVCLQTQYVHITTEGLSKYSLPTDYGINMSMSLLDGTATGAFQAGSTTTSWVLAADEDATEAELLGKEILVYSGTAVRQLAQVTNYDSTTKTATVSGCTVAPVAADAYVVIENYYEIDPLQAWEYDAMTNQKTSGVPNRFSIIGDDDNGEFLLYPAPYRSSGVPWGIKQRYYVDLMRVDLSATVMTALYRRWRNLFIAGIKAKCLEFMNDDRAAGAMTMYGNILSFTVANEKFSVEAPADMKIVPQFRG